MLSTSHLQPIQQEQIICKMGDKKATGWALLQVNWQPRASMHPADGLHACNTQSNPKYMISKQSAGTQAHLSRFDNSQRPDTSEGLLVKVGERSFHCSNHSDGLNLWAFTDA